MSPSPGPTSLELYLVRHAVAALRGPDYPDDADRPLTDDGSARFRRAVAGLRQAGVQLDLVLTSPYVRARETAELLATGLRPKPKVVVVEALAPGQRRSRSWPPWRTTRPAAAARRAWRWSATSPTSASWPHGSSAPRDGSSSRRAPSAVSTSIAPCRPGRARCDGS